MRSNYLIFLVLIISSSSIFAQTSKRVSVQLADTAMNRIWVDQRNQPGIPPKWNYEQGVIHDAIRQMWYATGDAKYFRHIQKGMDHWIDERGNHKDYDLEEYNIDHITPGLGMLTLYRATGNEKYKKIADLLRSQLKTHPRTKEGGFWHKKIYPYQMWLDGLYMGEPFYTEYSVLFGEDNFEDIANQFVWMEKNSRDAKTGMLYHGWDESKAQKWADKTTGKSPHVWGRAMGWYAMALVDTLDNFPAAHPRRADIIAILNREAAAIASTQDKRTGVWWDIMDQPGREKNYFESSASAMFVYAIAKGVRLGYLPEKYWKTAEKGWAGIQKEFIKVDPQGNTEWHGTVSVSGLGGNPYRDGSFDYYMSEKIRLNDAKGLGPAIKAALEMEHGAWRSTGQGKTVLLDDYFNHEVRKNKQGRDEVWHYKWDEMPDAGYYTWGTIFRNYWAKTASLSSAPTAANLKNAGIYIIVDPDTEKETAAPNYIQDAHVAAIADWVKKGGVLVMMGNDFGNAEFDNWNKLAGRFGIQFDKNSKFKVLNNDYKMGKLVTNAGNPIFPASRTLFLKELSTLTLSGDAKAVLESGGDKIMATVKYGKGTVFALGDPWIYNEYIDGRRLPAEFDNFTAAQDLSRWLLMQAKKK